ncbi:hypothetical protein L1987_73059 [Smallanthus sonchifolius]|uniref:Uncharacterized protein n=1 Tax=Smallanthus sonchifolius TaxID=185202 RepID=A0ACB9A0A1_9ASTR|nr:hypothetical protein L1987_73059 [Smallanthus sonchifolius]
MHNLDDGLGADQVMNRDLFLDMSLVTPVKVFLDADDTCVPLNQEYTGNSILDNLSQFDSHHNDMELKGGEDQEVNSDQINKTKAFCTDNVEEGSQITPLCMHSLNVALNMSAWEKLLVQPLHVKWPAVWGTTDLVGNDPLEGDILLNIRMMDVECVNNENIRALCNLFRTPSDSKDCETCDNFFDENNTMLGTLHKWKESIQQLRHEEVLEPALGLKSVSRELM